MTKITLQHSKVILLGMLVVLQGCSAFKASHFVPESAENMREWEVEGRFVLRADSTVSKIHFAFRQIGERLRDGEQPAILVPHGRRFGEEPVLDGLDGLFRQMRGAAIVEPADVSHDQPLSSNMTPKSRSPEASFA